MAIITIKVIITTDHGVYIEGHDDPGDTEVGDGEGDDEQVGDILQSPLLSDSIIISFFYPRRR